MVTVPFPSPLATAIHDGIAYIVVCRSFSNPVTTLYPSPPPCACPGTHKTRCVPGRPGPTTRPHHPARSTLWTRSQAWPDRCRADGDASSASPSHETAPEPRMVAGRCHSSVPPPLLAASLRAGGMEAARACFDTVAAHRLVVRTCRGYLQGYFLHLDFLPLLSMEKGWVTFL
jgi:hypothetical protein